MDPERRSLMTRPSPAAPSRIAGRGALLRSLRGLLRRIERYAEHRATTSHEQRWAARLADALDAAYVTGLSASGAQSALDAVDQRRAVSRKTPASARIDGQKPSRHAPPTGSEPGEGSRL